MGVSGTTHNLGLFFGAEAKLKRLGASWQEEQHNERKCAWHDTLDKKNPAPCSPAIGPIQIFGDSVCNQSVESPC